MIWWGRAERRAAPFGRSPSHWPGEVVQASSPPSIADADHADLVANKRGIFLPLSRSGAHSGARFRGSFPFSLLESRRRHARDAMTRCFNRHREATTAPTAPTAPPAMPRSRRLRDQLIEIRLDARRGAPGMPPPRFGAALQLARLFTLAGRGRRSRGRPALEAPAPTNQRDRHSFFSRTFSFVCVAHARSMEAPRAGAATRTSSPSFHFITSEFSGNSERPLARH